MPLGNATNDTLSPAVSAGEGADLDYVQHAPWPEGDNLDARKQEAARTYEQSRRATLVFQGSWPCRDAVLVARRSLWQTPGMSS